MAKKRNAQPAARSGRQSDRQFSMTEVVGMIREAAPDLAESLTQAEIELAMDDRGWAFLAADPRLHGDRMPQARRSVVIQSRVFWLGDPLAKQAVRLWTDYAFGDTGITFKAKDDASQATLATFMGSRQNRTVASYPAQQKGSKKLLVDGELFFAIFGVGPTAKIRGIDCLQITDFISNPDDEAHVLAYRRQTSPDVGNPKVLYYADWSLEDDDIALAEKQPDPVFRKGTIKLERDSSGALIRVYHLPFDTLGRRGNGLLSSVFPWSREHRRFMEARVGIQQALAKFAFKLTAKTGQKGLNTLQQNLQSSLVNGGLAGIPERNPSNSAGGTFAQNLGADLTAMPRSTGGSDAKNDGDQLKLQVCAGTGIMLHYFGDPSTGNLATATAMELPMLKQFGGYQELWKAAWRDIFSVVLEEDPDQAAEEIDVDLPPILNDDLQELGMFLTSAIAAFPEMKVPEVLKMLLVALNMNNVADVMKSVENKRTEIDANQEKIAAAAAANAAANPPPAAFPPNPVAQAKEVAVLTRLAAAIEESNRIAGLPLNVPAFEAAGA